MARAFLGTPQSRQKQQGAGSETDDPEAIPTTLEKAPQAPRAPAIGSQPSRQLQFGEQWLGHSPESWSAMLMMADVQSADQ